MGARGAATKSLGVLNAGLGIVRFLEKPTTQNLLRLAFDAMVVAAPFIFPGAGATITLAVTITELYTFEDGDTIIDKMLESAAVAIEDLFDCDIGAMVASPFSFANV